MLDDVLIPPIFHTLEHNKEQYRTHNLYRDILENTEFKGKIRIAYNLNRYSILSSPAEKTVEFRRFFHV